MRWLFDIYLPFAKGSLKELRSPGARLLVSLFCLATSGGLLWQVYHVYIQQPSEDPQALFFLSIPLLGAIYLLYVVYVALFASGRRVRKGLISPGWLKAFGYFLIPFGFWMLSQGRLDGALSIIAGLACLALAQTRGGRFFDD